jgi:DNA-binding phage protein
VPGPPPVALNARDLAALQSADRRLEDAEDDLIEARRAWAAVVRRLGISAVARELGVSRQAVRDRVLRIERGTR